jgi:anti-sigma B factor antagonist
MPDQTFQVTGRAGNRPGHYILQPKGAISIATRSALQEALHGVTGTALIIDLSEVPYIDSAALGTLVHTYVSCQKAQRQLALVGLTHRVSNVIKLSALDALFQTYATLPEAEDALK